MSRQVVGIINVGKFPHWIATSSDGRTAYVTNEGANSVSVIDVEMRRVVATIDVGNAPRKIVVQPGAATGAPGIPVMPAAAAGGAPARLRIENFAFAPALIKVAPGTTVVWTNADEIPHTSTSKDGMWDSEAIQPGATFSVTFDKPGTYVYGCTIHPFMQATVAVAN
ncbi:MAG TPA: plastocyanin/azurin family copper-binding protein [bacterium]|nr:plastocyanin/azurin family copper-binding protein [bacterium]